MGEPARGGGGRERERGVERGKERQKQRQRQREMHKENERQGKKEAIIFTYAWSAGCVGESFMACGTGLLNSAAVNSAAVWASVGAVSTKTGSCNSPRNIAAISIRKNNPINEVRGCSSPRGDQRKNTTSVQ